MIEPVVSIIIRVQNEAPALRRTLECIKNQVMDGVVEIVVLDNESTDDSAQVAIAAGARVFSLPRAFFGYGRALNIGVYLTRGPIVAMLSAHSLPQGSAWLSELTKPMRDDASIGAVFCRQAPSLPASRLELRTYERFPLHNTVMDRDKFIRCCRNGADPYNLAFFSNAACAIRRDVLMDIPFRDIPYGEDRAFVVDYLMAGGSVAYVFNAVVTYHKSLSWQSCYSAGYGSQVSKRLVERMAAAYTGVRFRSADSITRPARAVLVLFSLLTKLAKSAFEPLGLRHQSALYALRSTGATVGIAIGQTQWQRHIDSLSHDTHRFNEALHKCVPLQGR